MNKLMKKVALVGLTALIALSLGASSGTSAASAASCASTNFCTWYGPNYTEIKISHNCVEGLKETYGYSAINGCVDRAVHLLYWGTGGWNLRACMNPGGERPNPGHFGAINRLPLGSRC
jgi:hypothetical protein